MRDLTLNLFHVQFLISVCQSTSHWRVKRGREREREKKNNCYYYHRRLASPFFLAFLNLKQEPIYSPPTTFPPAVFFTWDTWANVNTEESSGAGQKIFPLFFFILYKVQFAMFSSFFLFLSCSYTTCCPAVTVLILTDLIFKCKKLSFFCCCPPSISFCALYSAARLSTSKWQNIKSFFSLFCSRSGKPLSRNSRVDDGALSRSWTGLALSSCQTNQLEWIIFLFHPLHTQKKEEILTRGRGWGMDTRLDYDLKSWKNEE